MKALLIPPIARDLVQAALSSFDGTEFVAEPPCPLCGGRVQGYDTKKKKFAVIREGDRERILSVIVKRFRCRTCGTLCYANEPFYPDTRIGSPVVDLCTTLSRTRAFSRTATVLDAMGIIVDRSSCRKYGTMQLPAIPSVDVFGMQLPFSVIALSTLSAGCADGSHLAENEMLAACRFPSSFRTPSGGPVTARERDEMKDNEK